MSLQRRKRLERLEARQPRGKPWTDPYVAAMTLWEALQAVAAGKACWLPVPEPELLPEVQQVFEIRLREADSTAARLTAAPSP